MSSWWAASKSTFINVCRGKLPQVNLLCIGKCCGAWANTDPKARQTPAKQPPAQRSRAHLGFVLRQGGPSVLGQATLPGLLKHKDFVSRDFFLKIHDRGWGTPWAQDSALGALCFFPIHLLERVGGWVWGDGVPVMGDGVSLARLNAFWLFLVCRVWAGFSNSWIFGPKEVPPPPHVEVEGRQVNLRLCALFRGAAHCGSGGGAALRGGGTGRAAAAAGGAAGAGGGGAGGARGGGGRTAGGAGGARSLPR